MVSEQLTAAPASRDWRDHAETAAVVALTVVAIVLRLPGLASRSLWLDEAWRANIAVAPTWSAFWSAVMESEQIYAPVPPVFALALRLAALIGGRNAGAVRAVPFLASVAAVPLAYLLARRLAGRGAALVAAACFACWPAVVLHGRELKQYSVDVALVLVLLLAVQAVLRRPDTVRAWTMYAIVAALGPGLSYPVTLVLPALALVLLFGCRAPRERAYWVGAHVVAGAAALGWYFGFIAIQRARPLVAEYWASDFPPAAAGALPAWTAAQLLDLARYVTASPVWLYLAIAALGYAAVSRWFRWAALLTLLTVVAAAAARMYPLAGGRTSLYLLPFLYLPIGAAAAWLPPRERSFPAVRLATILALAAVVALPARASLDRDAGLVLEETAPLIAQLRAERAPTDRVYVYYGAVPAFQFYHPERDDRIVLGTSHRGDAAAYEKELQAGLARGDRVWLLFAHVYYAKKRSEEADILTALRVYATQSAHAERPGASLHRFDVTATPGAVRHLRLTPEDMRDPERMKELLKR